MRRFDRSFATTNALRTTGTENLLGAARVVGVRRFVAQSYTNGTNDLAMQPFILPVLRIRSHDYEEPLAMNTLQAVPAADRVQIVDALYRFGAGQDLRDRTLFDAAFAEGARLDFRGPARKLGMSVPVFEGRRTIGDTIFATISHLDTTHTVTNPRVTAYDGEHARLFALVAAEHLPKDDHSRHLLLENIYVLWLSRAEDEWVIDHMQIENVWMRGDPTVLFGAASS